MNLDNIYQKRGDVMVRRIAGETLLIPIRSQLADMQKIFSMNTVAEFIWKQLDGKQSLKIIQKKVTDHFDVPRKQALSDIEEYIIKLKEVQIIEEVK